MNVSVESDSERSCCKESSGFGSELGKLLRKLRRNWFSKMDEPWPSSKRFAVALCGAMTYVLAFAVTVTERAFFLVLDSNTPAVLMTFSLAIAVTAAFFAWMVSFRQTRAGPVRLYLAGLALPALVTLILGFSLPGFDLAVPGPGLVQ